MEDVKINEMMARFITCACNKDSNLMKKVLDQQKNYCLPNKNIMKQLVNLKKQIRQFQWSKVAN